MQGFSRRQFLAMGGGAAAMSLIGFPGAALAKVSEKKLSFYNLHTGEKANPVFWAEGEFIREGLKEIQHVLRDHRNNQEHPIDNALLDQVFTLQHLLESKEQVHIISGYRSPESNAKLRANSNGVAKKSKHMEGKAIDLRIPGQKLAYVRKAALSMKAGGVGYYPGSQFVHLDTARFRQWSG